MHPLLRFFFHQSEHVEISGRDNITPGGAYLEAPNHISIFELPLPGAFWPRELEITAAVEILERSFQFEIIRLYGTVPVHRRRLDQPLISAL